jgi:hypothetical protein
MLRFGNRGVYPQMNCPLRDEGQHRQETVGGFRFGLAAKPLGGVSRGRGGGQGASTRECCFAAAVHTDMFGCIACMAGCEAL